MNNQEQLEELKKTYNRLQNKYGAKELDSIFFGGCITNPNICFIFMNPTGRNIATNKNWKGLKSPWIGTKNIWRLFYDTNLISNKLYQEIQNKKPKDWTYDFSENLYNEVTNNSYFITNLGKCTQLDARPLPDEILGKYLKLLLKEIDIIKPKVIISFGNQVSSIILNKKITVSNCRKQYFEKTINKTKYKIFPVYYPIGNGIFNIDKSIEDIKYIINNYLNKE